MTRASVSAAVLIGADRRMGEPKGLLRREEPNSVERTVATLRSVSPFLVGTADWQIPAALRACPSIDTGTSAADGVVTALDPPATGFAWWWPATLFLDAALLREMGELAVRTGRGVIATDLRGGHPLHAVWDRESAPGIRAAIERNERSLGALARLGDLVPLDLDDPGRSDTDRWSVFNVNTPDDLALARAHAGNGW